MATSNENVERAVGFSILFLALAGLSLTFKFYGLTLVFSGMTLLSISDYAVWSFLDAFEELNQGK
jgi:hypothetical protein